MVFVGSEDDHLYAIDAKTGAEQWRVATGKDVHSSPAVADGVIYIGSQDGYVYAVASQAAPAAADIEPAASDAGAAPSADADKNTGTMILVEPDAAPPSAPPADDDDDDDDD